MRARYSDTLARDIATQLQMSADQVRRKAHALGIKKNPQFIAEVARQISTAPDHPFTQSRFPSQHTPWNKGIKGSTGFHPACRTYHFRPGNRPHTWVPVGSYRIYSSKRTEPDLQLKVNDDPGPNHVRWVPVSRLVWEKAFGPVPDGHIVIFKPGQRTTVLAEITPDKLLCLTRRELMLRNSIHATYPPELARIHQLRGALTRQIRARERAAQETPHE